MEAGALGKVYSHGEIIFRQGEKGDSMYVVQDGYVEVVKEIDGMDSRLAVLGQGDFFGEMAIFENSARSATVRALGTTRVLTVDKRNFLRRIHEDPSLAYHLVQVMAGRMRKLGEQVALSRISQLDHDIPPEPKVEHKFGVRLKKVFSTPRQAAWV